MLHEYPNYITTLSQLENVTSIISVVSPLVALKPSLPLFMEAATHLITPEEAGLSMLEVVELINEDESTYFAFD